MSKVMCAIAAMLFVSMAQAQTAAPAAPPAEASCEAQAVSKEGKPLSGAAKKAAIKKCKADSAQPAANSSAASACEGKAVSKKSGKKLSGAAKQKFMEKCVRESA